MFLCCGGKHLWVRVRIAVAYLLRNAYAQVQTGLCLALCKRVRHCTLLYWRRRKVFLPPPFAGWKLTYFQQRLGCT